MRPEEGQTPAQPGVLFVTGMFVPLNVPGSFRLLRFTGWLRRAGWPVSVLTVVPDGENPLDKSLLDRLEAGVEVTETQALYPLRWLAALKRLFSPRSGGASGGAGDGVQAPEAKGTTRSFLIDLLSVPDHQVGWWPIAVRAGAKIVRSRDLNVIVSSGPPHSAHLVAMGLKFLTRRPWVMDLRDPWARTPWSERGALADKLNRRAERMCVRYADRIVLNTTHLLAEFRSHYSGLPSEKFSCVPNGFDEDLLSYRRPSNDKQATAKRFRITHAGNLYGKRDPTPLLRALHDLVRAGRVAPEQLEIVLVGSIDERFNLPELVQDMGLAGTVRIEPKVHHKKALELLADSDALLLIQQAAPLQTPSKLFEYMALRKPVLALTETGNTSALILEGNLGFAVSPDDHEALKAALLEVISSGFTFDPDDDFIDRFAGQRLSGDFERVIREAVGAESSVA